MDGSRFDDLTLRLAAIRLTRGKALRGIAAGALALAGGLGLSRPEPVEARCRHAANCTKLRHRTCDNNDACIRYKNVDTGRCACIQNICGLACTHGGECGSGLCVFGKGCCSATGMFCATPCPT